MCSQISQKGCTLAGWRRTHASAGVIRRQTTRLAMPAAGPFSVCWVIIVCEVHVTFSHRCALPPLRLGMLAMLGVSKGWGVGSHTFACCVSASRGTSTHNVRPGASFLSMLSCSAKTGPRGRQQQINQTILGRASCLCEREVVYVPF